MKISPAILVTVFLLIMLTASASAPRPLFPPLIVVGPFPHTPTHTPTLTHTPTHTPTLTRTPAGIWQPSGITPWQWQLTDLPVDQSYGVVMYDIDLFENDASVVASLHVQGRVVIAYFSAGSWEEWRPDANRFPASVKGNDLEGWPGEKWLDIRPLDILGPIMEARMDLAVQKGFDGVEPDNVDGHDNDTGFSITYDDQIAYNVFLASAAHQRGLSIALKNDLGQIVDLEPYFDWALDEQCAEYDECGELLPFIDAGKAVMHAEYHRPTRAFCPWSNQHGFSSMRKRIDLDAWMDPCWW